jgi:hypothetical protein
MCRVDLVGAHHDHLPLMSAIFPMIDTDIDDAVPNLKSRR